MHKTAIYLLLFIFVISLLGCKSTNKSFGKIADSVDRISKEVSPADSLSSRLMKGIFAELTKESSKEGIDSLSSNISEGIAKYLDIKIEGINTAPLGKKLIKGLKDGVSDKKNQDSIRIALELIFEGIDSTLAATIDKAFNELTSEKNKAKLSNVGDAIFNEKLSASLNKTLNDALKEKIDLSKLGESLRNDVLNDETKAKLSDILPPEIDRVLDIADKILKKLEEDKKEFWEKYFWQLLFGILAIIGLIGYMGYIIAREKKKNGKEANMNSVLMANINRMKNQNEYDQLTAAIWNSAIEKGIQPELKVRLESLGLFNNETWEKSK